MFSCFRKMFIWSCLLFGSMYFDLAARAGAQPSPEVVANVNGETITAEQLDRVVQAEIAALTDRIATTRREALNKLIDNRLIEQAARAEKLTVAEYLGANVDLLAVSDGEVDEAYRKSASRFQGHLPEEVKYRIRRTLEDNKRAEAVRKLLQRLRREAKVKNFLLESAAPQLAAAAAEGPTMGSPSAPVTVVEFIDFECPYCRRAGPSIRDVVRQSAGRARLVFKHFPLNRHAMAFEAAKAGVCAEEQGRFWELHDALFSGRPQLSGEGVAALAREIGLDSSRFTECMGAENTEQRVRRDIRAGLAAGVKGTPAVFVNGKQLETADALENAISEEAPKTAASSMVH